MTLYVSRLDSIKASVSCFAFALCIGLGAQSDAEAAARSSAPRSGDVSAAKPHDKRQRSAVKHTTSDTFMAMLASSARGRRALLAETALRSQTAPNERDRIVSYAAAVMPGSRSEIARAAEIGALVANRNAGSFPHDVRASQSSTTGSFSARPPDNIAPKSRSVAVFDTWNYVPQRLAPLGPTDTYFWATQREDLGLTYGDAARREFGSNWGNAAVGQAVALNAPGNGATGWRGRGVTVAVIDSGIDATFANRLNSAEGFSYVHPELQGRLDIRSRKIRANGTHDLDIGDDRGSHGTHVAGTIAANLNGVGMTGIAPAANIIALRGWGGVGAAEGSTIQAVAYAASQSDVRIINGSYGPQARQGERTWFTPPSIGNEFAAVRQAVANGQVLVYATGNDFEAAPLQAQNPTGIPLFPFIRPANARHGAYDDGGRNYDFSILNRLPGFIVAVTNVDNNFVISSDANRCGVAAAWCISAPGGGIQNNNTAGIFSTVSRGFPSNASGDTIYVGPDGNLGYAFLSGTSMAAPHVSGVIAVLMEAYPNYSARDIVRLMFATADDLGARGVDRIYGHGFVRLDRALAAAPRIDAIPDTFVQNIQPGQTQTWAAPISTDRELQVQGARSGNSGENDGDLVIGGVAEFRGGVRVSTGDLVVDGTLKAPITSVGTDARLLGDGLVAGNIVVDGALKPGSGPADLYVEGSVTMNRGGQFQVDIDGLSDAGGPGSYSRLVLFGNGNTFRAGGNFSASFRGQDEGADNTFTTRIGDRFRTVLAEDGARVVGRFERIETEVNENGENGLPTHARLALIYHPTSVTLAVNPASFGNLTAHGVTLSHRQSAVGTALDRMQDPVTGAIAGPAAEIFDRLEGLGPAEIAPALQELSGSGHAHVLRSAFSAHQQFTGLVGDRIAALRSGTAGSATSLPVMALSNTGGVSFSAGQATSSYAALNAPVSPLTLAGPQVSIWGKVFGHASHSGGDSTSPGSRSSGGGVIVGSDVAITSSFTLGVATSFARSHTKGLALAGETTSYLGALYAAYSNGSLEADAVIGLAHSDFRTRRTIGFGGVDATASSSGSGTGLIANFEVGYRLQAGAGTAAWIKPFAGLSYSNLNRSGFVETGAGALGLSFPSQRFAMLQSRVGVAFGATLIADNKVTYAPEISLAWGRSLSDQTSRYRTTLVDEALVLPVATEGRDALLANVKLTAELNANFRLSAGYSGEYRARHVAHRLEGGARWTW